MAFTLFSIISILILACVSAVLFFTNKVKQSQKELILLRKENSTYNNIYQEANDAMLVVDVATGAILKFNKRTAQILGYTPEQLSKLSIYNLHPTELLTQCSERIAEAWEKGGSIYQDTPFVTATKEILPVECSVTVADIADRAAVLVYARDIRERLLMEAEINEQQKVIEEKNKDITDSIFYAKRIQQAILPVKSELQQHIPESFILFKPKDIVSGDFYWFSKTFCQEDQADVVMVAAADCTGHGVPGAFMSLIGVEALNNSINACNSTQPAKILDYLHERVRTSLKQSGQDPAASRDGMDIALCKINLGNGKLDFAGAFRSLYIINKNKELSELKADKFSIGGVQGEKERHFTGNSIHLEKGTTVYLCSDGYADQFGGSQGKKMMTKRFKELLLEIQDQPLQAQKERLDNYLSEWRGNLEQLDDILVIGVRV